MRTHRATLTVLLLLAALAAAVSGVRAEDEYGPEWKALQARIDRLIAQFDKGGQEAVIALEQVVKIGKPAVLKLITATSSEKPQRRMFAVTALGRIRDERALHRVRFMVEHENEPLVRIAAVRALARFGDNSGGARIVEYLSHPLVEVRRYAVATLGIIRWPGAVGPLRARITYDKNAADPEANLERNPAVLCDIATALHKLGDDSGLPILAKLATNRDNGVRLLAVKALTEFEENLAVIALAVAMSDPDERISDIAYDALFKRRAKALEVLKKSYREEGVEESLKKLLARAIEELGGKVPDVEREKREAEAKKEAERCAKEVDALMPLLRDSDPAKRKEASKKLEAMGPKAVPRLLELFNEESNEVKLRIIGLFVLIKDERALPLLRSLVYHNVLSLRCRAAWALGEIPHRLNVPPLIDALSDPNGDMRFFAITSLQKLTGLRLGFEPNGSEESRAAAVARWKEWWEKNKNTFRPVERG